MLAHDNMHVIQGADVNTGKKIISRGIMQEIITTMAKQCLGGNMVVRNRLKSIRHKHEMNQKEFARYLGVVPNQYNRYEKQHGQPTLELALRFAKKLGVTVDHIFYIDENGPGE